MQEHLTPPIAIGAEGRWIVPSRAHKYYQEAAFLGRFFVVRLSLLK
jgi:hypothetical protein